MAKILNIITNPNPILRNKSKEVPPGQSRARWLKTLCADMVLTMSKKDGVGLAAPQIGKNIRLIAVNTKEGPVCMINPKLTKKSWRKEWGGEGCLSIPNQFGEVLRHKKAKCIFLDKNCETREIECEGLMARILQHEIDHLDGVLFIDKAKNIKKFDNTKLQNPNPK